LPYGFLNKKAAGFYLPAASLVLDLFASAHLRQTEGVIKVIITKKSAGIKMRH